MIPTFTTPYKEHDQLRIGWASWDEGSYQCRSIKFVYFDKSGKVSRGCPELPFDVLVDMVALAYQQNELSADEVKKLRDVFGA
ncbi:hypothetical protein J9253_07065 [Thiothrix litoralis]|uniref:Uncharacterized protein n=1 Tax=Thiothrix litoralis TaxID=2891210 RepID=A0ABX7WXD9_9GAMM|nr:hypothetical protein [Thiothrix litoralis]QTR47672.1 hypothetical protein J9253_07065 [Thiothrix litoralis]